MSDIEKRLKEHNRIFLINSCDAANEVGGACFCVIGMNTDDNVFAYTNVAITPEQLKEVLHKLLKELG